MSDTPMQPVTPAESAPGGDVVREQDKIMLVLCYFSLLALIPLLTVKDSAYVKWHAKQGLVLAIVAIAWSIVGAILNVIPVLGSLVYMLGGLGLFVLAIMGIIKAFEPTRWRIPGISALADKF